jgi:hypothetical protein
MKSKHQKRDEALQRKRNFLHIHREAYNKAYNNLTPDIRARAINGDVVAKGMISHAIDLLRSFAVAAAEAKVDLHGNSLC